MMTRYVHDAVAVLIAASHHVITVSCAKIHAIVYAALAIYVFKHSDYQTKQLLLLHVNANPARNARWIFHGRMNVIGVLDVPYAATVQFHAGIGAHVVVEWR